MGKFQVENLFLIFINSVLCTFTATGGYDFAVKNPKVTYTDIETDISKFEEGNDENIDA